MNKTRNRFAPLALGVALLSAGLLALTLNGTLSAFVAQITNSTNTAATGALVMEEKNGDGTITCTSNGVGSTNNAATCATINKFGGSTSMVPGTTVTTNISIKNSGTIAATAFTLQSGGACTQAAAPGAGTAAGTATNLCTKMNIVITRTDTSAVIYSGTLAALGTAPAITIASPPAAGVNVPISFALTLDPSADNTHQGLQASMPLVWKFTN